MSKEIQLTRGYVTIVDDIDYKWLNKWKWHATGTNKGGLYAARQFRRKGPKGSYAWRKRIAISMSRLIMGNPEELCVDHINGNTLDNRKANLRICSHQQNLQNANRHIGLYKGVSERYTSKKNGRTWGATITLNNKTRVLGIFSSPQDAARAYDRAALELFSEYACTNFPKKWYEAEDLS